MIPAPTSTENKDKARDPEMHSSKKGNQWHFGMKVHIGVDAQSGLVHAVKGTSGHVHDIIEANSLLHGDEQMVFADAGYRGIEKRLDTTTQAAAVAVARCGSEHSWCSSLSTAGFVPGFIPVAGFCRPDS